MIRWLIYLVASLVMQVITWIITPILPLFSVRRMGWCDNHSYQAVAPRLPIWLSWFDTSDNSLGRDGNHIAAYGDTYFSRFYGLWKNSLYGFRWTVLSMPIETSRMMRGNPQIDYHTKTYGTMYIKQPNGAWQYKLVKPFLGKILVLNLGWLLDDISQERALFMFSPRLK